MVKTNKPENKLTGARVLLQLKDGQTVRGIVEKVEETQLFLIDEETNKKVCFDKNEVDKIEQEHDE